MSRSCRPIVRAGARLALCGLALGAVQGCRDAPRLRPAPPTASTAGGVITPPAVSSRFTVPVVIDVSALIAEVERQLPATWGSLDSLRTMGDDGPPVAFELRRDAFTGEMREGKAVLETTVHYRFRTRIDLPLLPDAPASCGTNGPEPRMRVEVSAPLGLTGDWRLVAGAHELSLSPLTDEDRDRCEVTIFGIDVTERLARQAQEVAQAERATIDSLLAAVDVRSRFEGWWKALSQPMALGDGVWLNVGPVGVAIAEVGGTGPTVQVVTTLIARPQIHVGAEPVVDPRPLPALITDPDPGAPGFTALIQTYAEYGALSRELEGAVSGTELHAAGHTVRIESFTVHGLGGGRIAIRIGVVGDVRGELYLVGSPTYDPDTRTIHMPDLRFDAASSNALVDAAAWVLDTGALEMIRRAARWSVDDVVEWAGRKATEGLNSSPVDGVHLEGALGSLEIVGLDPRAERLEISAIGRGTLTLRVGGS